MRDMATNGAHRSILQAASRSGMDSRHRAGRWAGKGCQGKLLVRHVASIRKDRSGFGTATDTEEVEAILLPDAQLETAGTAAVFAAAT